MWAICASASASASASVSASVIHLFTCHRMAACVKLAIVEMRILWILMRDLHSSSGLDVHLRMSSSCAVVSALTVWLVRDFVMVCASV